MRGAGCRRDIRRRANDTWTTAYDYFKNGRLASVDVPGGVRVDYTYDAAGKPNKEM